ncbi:hypothetical protein GQ53DRAFT_713297 [Thozetella sp. PMI_491]|nr:hypothetical protein GQ53DRAFT_713297 [Thozetella sp. PMI_491]
MGLSISTSVTELGFTTSNLPNIYRDGGGGGVVNGLHLMVFSDGIYTTGGVPKDDFSNWLNFSSNSIAVSAYLGAPVQSLTDFGSTAKGPRQQIPFYYNSGESDSATGIWPNQNLITLCDGGCAVSFPEVIARNGNSAVSLYNTPINIQVGAFGPVVTRPVQALFRQGEPLYGTYCSVKGIDGYIYMYAKITGTTSSNGLKLARVPWNSYADRSQYRYWNGVDYVTTIPPYDDGGKANVFNHSENFFGTLHGPGYGDIFYSQLYKAYIMLFQSENTVGDSNLYLTYSSNLEKGWSTPSAIWQIPHFDDGYSYSLHAYPDFDSTSRVVPISWNQYSPTQSYRVGMANITFS